MKPILTVGMGFYREVALWIIRMLLLAVIAFLGYKIYEVNPFFVQVFGGFLMVLTCIIQEEKVIITNRVVIHQRRFFFNLINVKKQFKINELKEIIVAGNTNFTYNLGSFIFPYFEKGYNEIRFIYKNREVKNYRTAIYLDDLLKFETGLKKLLNSDKPPISQPIYRNE